MPPAIRIKPEHLALTLKILAEHAPHAEVWAYGSRVDGSAHDASDLDLVLRDPGDLTRPQKNLVKLRAAFQESNLPIFVDVFDWARIPERFRQQIVRSHILLQTPRGAQSVPSRP